MSMTTELAQRMKAAALKATQGEWCAFSDHASGTYAVHTLEDKRCGDVIKWPGFDGQENAERNAEFIALANPANVLALVEALETAEKRIAELEARTVKLPQSLTPEGYHIDEAYMVDDDDGEYLDRDEVIAALSASGVAVEGESS